MERLHLTLRAGAQVWEESSAALRGVSPASSGPSVASGEYALSVPHGTETQIAGTERD